MLGQGGAPWWGHLIKCFKSKLGTETGLIGLNILVYFVIGYLLASGSLRFPSFSVRLWESGPLKKTQISFDGRQGPLQIQNPDPRLLDGVFERQEGKLGSRGALHPFSARIEQDSCPILDSHEVRRTHDSGDGCQTRPAGRIAHWSTVSISTKWLSLLLLMMW